MRLEKIYNRPLQEDEMLLKKSYKKENAFLWDRPMTFTEYEQYKAEGLIAQTPTEHYYKEKSIGQLGVTVNDVVSSSHTDVTIHTRYSYPVLHNHDYIEIIYVAVGSCQHFFEKTSFQMNEGDICIMAPFTLHTLSCTNDESCILNLMISKKVFSQNFLNLLRGGKVVSEFLEKIIYQHAASPYILFPTKQDPWLLELARRLLTEKKLELHAYEYSISLLANEFLLHISREYEPLAIVPDQQGKSQNTLIVAVLSYLSVNYSSATLHDTAAFFGYSSAYLSRFIRENTGKTYNTIITELQMEHAAKLLKSGEYNLTEIAHTVGCFDSSHFNKKFKSIYGISPKQYLASIT